MWSNDYCRNASGNWVSSWSKLSSWTTVSDSAGYFWGIGRYTTTFDLPAGVKTISYLLSLGDVREVADVRLNGESIGTA